MAVEETLIDFNRICRLCMTEEATMCSIFSEQIGAVPLPLRIMACVSIEITATDGLPTSICSTCLQQVDGWYKFKDLCENADATLRKLLNSEPVDYGTITQIRNIAVDVKKYFSLNQGSKQNETGSVEETENVGQIIKNEKLIVAVKEDSIISNDPDYVDNYSSDDDLTLLATKEKLLKEIEEKRSKTEETVLLRTVQTQTEEDDTDAFVLEFNVEKVVRGKTKKCKSHGSQTTDEENGFRKRFRIRAPVPSACTLCDKVYKNAEILRQHMKSHHVSGTLECPRCQLTFNSVRSLKYHEQRKHSNLEPVPCSFCGKEFLDKKYLRIHENIHSQANQYVCQFCGRKFIMKTNLTVHINRHHTAKTNDFICQVCGKAFPFKLYLKKHFKTHTDYKPHPCNLCDARFREGTLLRKHINSIHLKLRPFICHYCQKTFTRGLYLRDHMESQHLGISKKAECARCGLMFHNKGRLRQHECKSEQPDVG